MVLEFSNFEELVKHIKSKVLETIDTKNGSYDMYATPKGDLFVEQRSKTRKSASMAERQTQSSGRFNKYEGSGGDVIIRCDEQICVVSGGVQKEYKGLSDNGTQILPVVKEGEITQEFLDGLELTNAVFQTDRYLQGCESLKGACQILTMVNHEFNAAVQNNAIAWFNLQESMKLQFPLEIAERNIYMRKRLRERLNANTEKICIAANTMRDYLQMLQEYNAGAQEYYSAAKLSGSL